MNKMIHMDMFKTRTQIQAIVHIISTMIGLLET